MPVDMVCTQCGTKNKLGAIFCKECGAKLDMEATHQKLKEHKESFNMQDFKHYLGIVRKVVVWALLVLFVVVLVGLFMPAKMASNPNFGEEQRKAILGRLGRVIAECKGNVTKYQKEHAFSEDEVTFLANYLCRLEGASADDEDVGYALSPERLSVTLLSTQYVKIVLKSKAFKKVGIYSTIVGRFVERDDGYDFVIKSAKMGRVGLPGPAKSIVVDRFKPLFKDLSQVSTLSQGLATIEVYDKELVVRSRKKSEN